jgi:cell division protein FtsL
VASRVKKRGRGRSLVAVLLVGFVAVAAVVIFRRSSGIKREGELRDLERQRVELAGRRARLEGEIRELSSRGRLAPVAEQRLHMKVPGDSQTVLLDVPVTR